VAEVYRDHLRSEQVYLSTIQETVARREAQRDKFEQVLHKKDEGFLSFFLPSKCLHLVCGFYLTHMCAVQEEEKSYGNLTEKLLALNQDIESLEQLSIERAKKLESLRTQFLDLCAELRKPVPNGISTRLKALEVESN